MKRIIPLLLIMPLYMAAQSRKQYVAPHVLQKNSLVFMENKGQIRDQAGRPVNDIQFSLRAGGVTVFVGSGRLQYQFERQSICTSETTVATERSTTGDDAVLTKQRLAAMQQGTAEIYRMDVEVAGANRHAAIIAEDMQEYCEHYYLPGCPPEGLHAHAFRKITYKNIFDKIDWVILLKDDRMEYEFVIWPGGDPSNIRLKYNGQTSLMINDNGSVAASTPYGVIKEQAPVCYDNKGEKIPSSFRLHGNTLSYSISEYDGRLVIDPLLEWGTYYGADSGSTIISSISCDDSANVYACGSTSCLAIGTIATAGSFLNSYSGNYDAFLVKFDSSGNRLWGTYYGGTGQDLGKVVATDHYRNEYIAGYTTSLAGIGTPGTQEPFFMGGQWDGFLAKFTSGGMRKFGTYVGGTIGSGWDIEIASVNCDNYGHVYVSGACDDTANISTPGCFKYIKTDGLDHYDCYLQQYDTMGIRKWGTYYGGNQNDYHGISCTDGFYVYLAGYSVSDTGIASAGSFRPHINIGSADAFMAKFDSSGNRLWGTYYGGESDDISGGIVCKDNAVYFLGCTLSDTGIASPGCYQPARAGGIDVFLAKFNALNGYRIWGTYYGGPGDDMAHDGSITMDNSGNVYFDGYTNSATGIASVCSWQTTLDTVNDAFLAKYDNTGMQQWATYYGGNGDERPWSCAYDGSSVYMCGTTSSSNNIATTGSFMPSCGGYCGYSPGFLAKFVETPPDTLSGATAVCKGLISTFSDNISGGMWISSNPVVATIDAVTGAVTGLTAGIVTITYSLSPGCYYTSPDTIVACPDAIPVIGSSSGIKLQPNPVRNQLVISCPDKITMVSISNQTGREVYKQKYNTSEVHITMADLPQGVYTAKIYSGTSGRFTTQKFVKE